MHEAWPYRHHLEIFLRLTRSSRLIKSTVESVRTRLDRVYLESLQASQKSGRGSPVPADEISALQEELDSLYLEILPVAQMSIEQQYLEPALKSLSGKNSQILGRSSSAVSYVGFTIFTVAQLELTGPDPFLS